MAGFRSPLFFLGISSGASIIRDVQTEGDPLPKFSTADWAALVERAERRGRTRPAANTTYEFSSRTFTEPE